MKPTLIIFAIVSLILSTESVAQNSAPYAIGPKKKWAVPGQITCITIQTADSNANDTVRISWNTAVQTATFTHNNGTVKHASGEFCWNPTQADAGLIPYPFFITLDDGHVQVEDTFFINVQGIPERDSFHITKGECGQRIFKSSFNEWTDQVSYELSNGMHFGFNMPVEEISFGGLKPGTYVLRTRLTSKTPVMNNYVDTIIVTEGHDVTANIEPLSEPNEYRVTLTEHSGNPNVHYTWTLENSLGISLLPDTLPELTVQVWENTVLCAISSSDQNCRDTVCFSLSVDPSGVPEIEKPVRIYPNPCIDQLNIESHKPILAVTLFDIQGKPVLQKEEGASLATQLEVVGLPKGTYMIAIRYMDGSMGHHALVVR